MLNESLKVVLEEARAREFDLPVHRRILLYRGLAEFCGDVAERKELHRLAAQLEATERACREFRFSFRKDEP